MKAYETNFDGLIGPTHNYSGLSLGNIASVDNNKQVSNPRDAALQGLSKMKALADLGFVQGVLAPHSRPNIPLLKKIGFSGKRDQDVLLDVAKKAPAILSSVSSASSMWTANAATVSPSADTQDRKVHITPANLVNKFHRFIEAETTSSILKATFCNKKFFVHHEPLPAHETFGDEGAANHTRFCRHYGEEGVELFVYGRYADLSSGPYPQKFPARQTREACEAIVRLHQLKHNKVIYAQQSPKVIDQGVFHNDVIAVGNRNCLFFHEEAYLSKEQIIDSILESYGSEEFYFIEVKSSEVSVSEAVSSYLFNSQLLSLDNDKMLLLVPEESRTTSRVWEYLNSLIADHSQPITQVMIKDVKQSMKNGGGPACLRLRVVLTEEELTGVNPNTLLNEDLYQSLVIWVQKHYRDRMSQADLVDPNLLSEVRTALDELTQILHLGSLYDFQKDSSQI